MNKSEIVKINGVRVAKATLEKLNTEPLPLVIGSYQYEYTECRIDGKYVQAFKRIKACYLDTTGYYDSWNWEIVAYRKEKH
jgi:hypothetical protein